MPVCKLLDFSVKTKYILHQNQLNVRSVFSTLVLLLAIEKGNGVAHCFTVM